MFNHCMACVCRLSLMYKLLLSWFCVLSGTLYAAKFTRKGQANGYDAFDVSWVELGSGEQAWRASSKGPNAALCHTP